MNHPEEAITLKMIMASGLIKPETILFSKTNPNVTALLHADGTISVTVKGQLKKYSFPSGAARAVENISLNGWIYWAIKEESGALKELSIFREEYRKTKKIDK